MEKSIELWPSPRKAVSLLAGCGAFVALAVVIASDHPVLAWLTGLFFGLGVVVALVALIPGSSGLRLEEDRMAVRSLFRSWSVRREDISGFFVAAVGGQAMVCWNSTPTAGPAGRAGALARRLSRAVSGAEAGLPDTYGYRADALALRLNRWLEGGLAAAA